MPKNLILSIFIFGIFLSFANAQEEDLSILRQNRKYYQSGQVLAFPDMETLLRTFPESESQIRKCNLNYNIALPPIIFGSIGLLVGSGICISAGIQTDDGPDSGRLKENMAIGKGILVASGVLESIGMSFIVIANHHKKKGIRIYNSKIKETSFLTPELLLICTSNGPGIRLKF